MKIDKSNPLHWLYLAAFTVNAALVLVARWFRRGGRDAVILYGHKLNGNLKAILAHAATVAGGPRLFFLTMDPVYYRALKKAGHPVLLGLNPLHMFRLAGAYALVSDHGLHALILLLKFSDLKFVDVWHGIPFKGFDRDDFRVQQRYDEVWVASELLRKLYIGRFGFRPEVVKVTGYARTDGLVDGGVGRGRVLEKLGIADPGMKIVLFAPTWQQDDANRSIFPFGVEEDAFLARLNAFCLEHGAVCVLRKHLNTRSGSEKVWERVLHRPYEDYPDAEEILLVSDCLICDWSSIAFDYLLLDRPTLFLDVPPPFRKGLSLDASYRFGQVVGDMDTMFSTLGHCLGDPEAYRRQHGATYRRVRQQIYGDMADGQAAERCYIRLLNLAQGCPARE
ncbi:CDP-glycerol--glycerophosphate glycerophosphotransferase [Parasulfuritortus cantonensis]|uniref:CDP-glycerol--glycerophosphate glycerophosphotransferase n=1 Tax=Parasulfuritortus cantonensis TaxID=2528202 RepID=A0A4R1BCG8_9PROT|nr:CDP-glycerol glycerophosphotransferase family protein [Parasulfuritortus cantonensis]TCJ14739.1 CDP-glycerol--glycerophosphate glycerophosphotransferase [Parasulfuritortus cantonensis]